MLTLNVQLSHISSYVKRQPISIDPDEILGTPDEVNYFYIDGGTTNIISSGNILATILENSASIIPYSAIINNIKLIFMIEKLNNVGVEETINIKYGGFQAGAIEVTSMIPSRKHLVELEITNFNGVDITKDILTSTN